MNINIINKTSQPDVSLSTFINESQRKYLQEIVDQQNVEFTLVRGAFHNSCTQLKVVFIDDTPIDTRREMLQRIAQKIDWHYTKIDGTYAIIKQKITNPCNTWSRWKKNNTSSHLRESSKKNWEVYHTYLGDLDEVGKWDDTKFNPSLWRKA